jgi:hypothetical protein
VTEREAEARGAARTVIECRAGRSPTVIIGAKQHDGVIPLRPG